MPGRVGRVGREQAVDRDGTARRWWRLPPRGRLMDATSYLRLVRGETRGIGPTIGRAGLTGLSWGYRLGAALRNTAYDRGWAHVERAEVPVIAIGNLTLGGTGKTPMVEWACRRLRARGLRVAILSRGYGGTSGLNDEGRVLEENLPDVPHLQGKDRAGLARIAVGELATQVIVLDDGFQHRRLARDLDIVLLDALEPFGLGRLTPRGLLREPVGSLRRAGVVVLARADLVSVEQRAAIRAAARRAAGDLPWAEARHAPIELVRGGAPALSPASLHGQRVAAFCGLGNPEGFRRTVARLDLEPVGFRAFPDHHPYTAEDVAALVEWGRAVGADLLLTTQKDWVKLRDPSLGPLPLYALRIGLEFLDGESVVEQALASAVDGIERD